MSNLMIFGCGLVAWSIGALLISLGRFTVGRDISGLTIYTDKKTGKEYATLKKGWLKEL